MQRTQVTCEGNMFALFWKIILWLDYLANWPGMITGLYPWSYDIYGAKVQSAFTGFSPLSLLVSSIFWMIIGPLIGYLITSFF